jgi:hypothetical protein
MITCSDVDVSGDDGSGRIAGYASVELGVDVLLVVLGAERRENQTARRLNLPDATKLRYSSSCKRARCHGIKYNKGQLTSPIIQSDKGGKSYTKRDQRVDKSVQVYSQRNKS